MTILQQHRLVDGCLAHPKIGLELWAQVRLGTLERDIWLA
jgi:hypothetical protein